MREGEHKFPGVLSGAHLTDGGAGLGQGSHGVLRRRQRAIGDRRVNRPQQVANLVRRTGAHQQQIGVVERQIAAERVEVDTGVLVDVALTDLHEATIEGQQLQPRPLGDPGQGVQHDVDTVTVGVTADFISEIRCPRVVYTGDTHRAE